MEYLRQYFDLTVYYYNPNITEDREYQYRLSEEKRLIAEYNRQVDEQDFDGMHSGPGARKIQILEAPYDPENWLQAVRGLEMCPEGGERCGVCFEMRLRKAAKAAAEGKFDYFTTTLTISPMKNTALLNEIGMRLSEEYGVAWLPSDFKKKDGYKRSIELSRKFDLYRQDYCGCGFSKAESERAKRERAESGGHD
ncbi:MAG: epoxyqueuosine reductase QueH [Lachnospiraceae bacterium]|nr:epoxyqueuosine reductase QueH [Lachnospiraceae bacterium]